MNSEIPVGEFDIDNLSGPEQCQTGVNVCINRVKFLSNFTDRFKTISSRSNLSFFLELKFQIKVDISDQKLKNVSVVF